MSRTGAGIVAGWASANVALTVVLVLYGGPSLGARAVVYGSACGLTLLAAVAILAFGRRDTPKPTEWPAREPSGAPALAAAGACLVGGLAWVFGVYLAYLAVPLLAYATGKWAADRKAAGGSP